MQQRTKALAAAGAWASSVAAVCMGGMMVITLFASPATAGPIETCLGPGEDARAAVQACHQAEGLIRLSGRDTKRANPRNNPALPPALRASRQPIAYIQLARAKHLALLGDRAEAAKALARAEASNDAVPGIAAVRALVEQSGSPTAARAVTPPIALPTAAPGERQVTASADVLFDFGRAEIRPEAAERLKTVAAVLDKQPQHDARIEGHTDAKGSAGYNLKLSTRRAEAVRDWLVRDGRLDTRGFVVRGYGESRPLAPNTNADGSDNPAGRQRNRRVEVIMTAARPAARPAIVPDPDAPGY